jgi:hypothetical protein
MARIRHWSNARLGGALKASTVLGAVWALWHLWPYIQTGNGPAWVMWQSLGSIPLRILIVWLYNNTGKSILAGILFHAMVNVSEFSFPNYGSHYDPFISCIIFALVAAIVVFMWGPRTFIRYRFAWFRLMNNELGWHERVVTMVRKEAAEKEITRRLSRKGLQSMLSRAEYIHLRSD